MFFLFGNFPQNIADTCKNVKNITKTLSERQQFRAASVFYAGMYDYEDFTLPQQEVVYKKSVVSDTPLHRELKNIMGDTDMLVAEVNVPGQGYKTGDLVALKMTDCDTMDAGLIESILVKNNQVYFICKVYICTRNWLQYFESQSCNDQYKYVHYKKIADYKPLVKRGTTLKFEFVLHHRISFEYN